MKVKKTPKKNYKMKEKGSFKYNHEITGILIFAFGILTILSFYFKDSIGLFGTFIRETLLGMMGLPSFLIPPLIIIYGIFVLFRKDDSTFKLRIIYIVILLVLLSSLLHTADYRAEDNVNKKFLNSIVDFYSRGVSIVPDNTDAAGQIQSGNNIDRLFSGGVLGGLVSMPLLLTFQTLGTIIILTTLSLIVAILLTNISITSFILNVRSLFVNTYNKTTLAIREAKSHGKSNDLSSEPGVTGNFDDLQLEFSSRPKVIDFNIQKTSRELKEKINGSFAAKNAGPSESEIESVEFIMKDLKKNQGKEIKKELKKEKDGIEKEMDQQGKQAGEYKFPPIELLKEDSDLGKNFKTYKNMAIEGAKKLEDTLNSFGVAAKVINISRGPSVTRYELQPSVGVKVSKIVNLADDISLNLAASGVRIEAPIPGKAAIGIEVPNKEIMTVTLREVVDSQEFTQHASKLAFAIGKDISGECIVADIAKMPHLLIAGATGSGKSVCINSLIVSLIYKASPDEVKLLMVDPKVVELGIYNGIPHLLIPVVTDPKKAAGALNWAVQEMVNRYKLFADKAVRDIKGYNEVLRQNGEPGILPQIVIIIDELADLMMVAPNDVEDAICRLAQMARAAGMHLVIATQRPSVDVITGVIKANVPSRISFAVSSQIDSRTILDMAGAEKLLGRGDMLFYPVGKPKPIRVQGAFVSDEEVERIVEFIKSQGSAEYDDNIIEEINSENETADENDPGDKDELLSKAIELVVETGQASVSLIQRKFKVGYARAARIIDQMEARGIVGGFEGSKPRQILITRQQWHEMQMAQDS